MKKYISFALSGLFVHTVVAEAKCIDGDTIAQGKTCTIPTNQTEKVTSGTLKNNGSLVFEKYATLKFESSSAGGASIITINGDQRGKIEIQGSNAEINATGSDLTITKQDINFGARGDRFTIITKSLTLGDDTDIVNIIGRESSSSITLDTAETLKIKNANLKNLGIAATSLKALNLKTAILENSSIQTNQDLTISKENGSNDGINITAQGKNYIRSQTKVTLKDSVNVSGGGLLVFGGGNVEVGNGTEIVLKGKNSSEEKEKKSALGFHGQSDGVLFKKVSISDLRVQIIRDGDGATLKNVETTITGGILEGRDTVGGSQVLVIESGNTSPTIPGQIEIGKITVNTASGSNPLDKTTFQGTGIKIYGQEVTIGDASKAHTLIMQTEGDKGEITLGKENSATQSSKDGDVVIKGEKSGSNSLQLRGSKLGFGGNVTLQDLSIRTQSGDTTFRIVGKNDKSVLSLENTNFEAGIIDEKGKGKYQSLYFLSEDSNLKSKLNVKSDVNLKASDFIFQNQNTDITQNKSLSLYAYGAVDLPAKESDSVQAKKLGNFVFESVAFEAKASSATLKLYSGEDGAKIHSRGLVLKNINLQSYVIPKGRTDQINQKNTFDLSDKSSNLTALVAVIIEAKDFKYFKDGKRVEGIGMDLFVGNQSEIGKLTLKSEANEADPKFYLGGNLTIDNTAQNGDSSSFDIEVGTKKLSEYGIDLIIEGGLSAIHKDPNGGSGGSTMIKAKSFDFASDSRVYSKNGKLELSSADGQIEVKGKTVLEGTETAKASIEAKKNGNDAGTLTLHDVEVRGSAELKNGFKFQDTNLSIYGVGNNKTFTITGSNSPITGIKTIMLQDGILNVQNGVNQELKLNQGAVISSSGESELKTAGISVDGDTFVLKVLDGTLKITETAAKNAIGAITLGQKEKNTGANLELIKDSGGTTYNTLKIKAPLTSYGNSSILASSFEAQNPTPNQPLMSIIGGELKMISKHLDNNQELKLQSGEIKLENGSLSFYKRNGGDTLGKITLGGAGMADSKISSSGKSSIQASELKIEGSEIYAQNGNLDLIGLQSNGNASTFGNITLNGAGLNALNADKQKHEAIKLIEGKTITMIASSPFVSPAKPLGGASFGKITAKSVEFESGSGKLINLKVSPTEAIRGEALFAVAEGDQILIETTEGITKKVTQASQAKQSVKITLEDISLNAGGYRSLIMTPKLIEDDSKQKVLTLALGVSVKQTTILELTESIESKKKREEMVSILKDWRLEEIANSILLSKSNPLKVGLAENTINGNVEIVSEALYHLQDGLDTLAQMAQTHYKLYEQITMLTNGTLQNRLTRLGNPLRTSLASLLQNLSKNAYASNDDLILLDEASLSVDKGGIWASYSGANRSGKDVSANISGLSAGYDAIFDGKVLFGGFVSYLYGAYKEKFLRNQSHNINFGFYSRMAFGGNEIDWTLSQMIGINTGTLNLGTSFVAGNTSGELEKYNFYATDLQLRYGYAFALGEEENPYYLKPFVGVTGAFLYNQDLQTKAYVAIRASGMKDFFLDVSAGLELRKYFNPQSYFFLMPLVQAGVFDTQKNVQAGFVGASSLHYALKEQDEINVGVYAGGEGSVADNLSVIGNFGIKMGVKKVNVLTSWNLGLKYKF